MSLETVSSIMEALARSSVDHGSGGPTVCVRVRMQACFCMCVYVYVWYNNGAYLVF